MRFAVETWAPDYGSPTETGALEASDEVVDAGVEVPIEQWAPCPPPAGLAPEPAVSFLDGVRRIDARVWVTDEDGTVHQGICASYGAGLVRCDGAAVVQRAEIRRSLFCPSQGAGPIETIHGRYPHCPVATGDPDGLSLALQQAMTDLEQAVSQAPATPQAVAASPAELLVVDGPLRQRLHLSGAVGFVKTHQRSYLPAPVAHTVAALGAGERTPLFQIGGRFSRWSWYLRLPGERTHGWAGVVRCEASLDLCASAAAGIADRTARSLPRFASVAHKDARAPQNLFPIAGLELQLRHRLGDPAVLLRALRRAAASAGVDQGPPPVRPSVDRRENERLPS